jgi:formylglycine-generating enzyme required for sulfatase activity
MLPELVSIPAGPFVMGSRDGARDKQPMRTVHVSAFAFAVHAVINAEYRRFLVASGHRAPERLDVPGFAAPRQPVVAVSWFDAVPYCAWLASMTGAPCRLPTEAEREKAALGAVDGARYPWGDDAAGLPPEQRADAPDDVCRGAPNGYGLHDLGDFVHEWCSDWYAADAYGDALCRATQPTAGSHVRGLGFRGAVGALPSQA